jgi:WD40 repeat protein/serine/threonine protein kinase
MPNPNADTNLLFGILALQMDFIDREQLVAAMHAWVLDKGQPLGAILLQQKALASAEHALLDALVQKHLERHGHDPQQSLAAVSSVKPVRDELQQIADTDLQSSLAHVSTRQAGDDVFGTRSVGTATAAGQRFRILRPHARGGLGQVSVARDEELGREVALKEIQDRHADNVESRLRFLLEAEITGGLEHPGIVPVYGLGKYDDGRPYYAMRFIQGDSLKEAIERFHNADAAPRNPGERALAMRQLLGRFVDVCEAIEYAHSRAVLHRDLKPGNIMLGKYGETLVVDWGLAKPLDRPELAISTGERALRPASASGSAPTQMGSALGTPQYMSPEQAAGHLDRLGTASDVYSLGATLYCLLTGRAPFEGVDVGTVLQRVQRGEFPPPRQVKRQVPEALEAICLKAMALQPERRYASARALADDVEHWLADEPVSAWREPWLVTARRWLGRHRTLVTATAATIVAATVLLSAATVLLVAAYRQADEYARAETRERRRAEAAEKQALEALAESHQRLVRLTTGQGLQLLDEGDLLGSLPWLAEALKLDEGHATREAIDRLRLASVLQQAPRIAAVWVHEGPVNAATFSADGRFVATASADGSARVWDTVSRGPVGSPLKHAGELHHVAFSPDGRYVVTASADHTARVWNAASGTPVTPPLRHEREVLYALFSADNNHVLTASADGTARIWDCTTGQQLGQPLTHDGPVVHASFSPNGQSIVTASLDKTAQVWDAATGAPRGSPLRHQSGVRHAAFSPDGRWIVTAGEDRLARVWDVESGRSIGAPLAHREEVNDAAFSHDGRRIITAINDYTARVWNAADGRPVTPPLQHNHWVHAAAFSPDGQRVVTASEDQTARLWDAETGRPLSPPLSHGNGVRCAQFSPDGRRVLTAGLDAAVRIWEPSLSSRCC